MAAIKATTTLKLNEQKTVRRKQLREAFEREAMDSLQAFRETGEYLTWAEIDAWLASWGTEDDQCSFTRRD